mmetsp:Transcript_17571/g.70562  ORF Transcript_17571/g.70562 Transcript_17571/m.70562 type:complete len:257 (-) Transcript_17571:39-809(-)
MGSETDNLRRFVAVTTHIPAPLGTTTRLMSEDQTATQQRIGSLAGPSINASENERPGVPASRESPASSSLADVVVWRPLQRRRDSRVSLGVKREDTVERVGLLDRNRRLGRHDVPRRDALPARPERFGREIGRAVVLEDVGAHLEAALHVRGVAIVALLRVLHEARDERRDGVHERLVLELAHHGGVLWGSRLRCGDQIRVTRHQEHRTRRLRVRFASVDHEDDHLRNSWEAPAPSHPSRRRDRPGGAAPGRSEAR